jgi:hypothetical protein
VPDVSSGADSAERWRQVRGVLTRRRGELSRAAGRLYPDLPRVGSTGLLCRAEWLADQPLAVDDPRLGWVDQPPAPVLEGTGPLSAHVRPRTPGGDRHRSYSDAIAALDAPALFDNRACYRLLEARLAGPPELIFCRGWYFDGVNLGHAVAHELAAAWQDSPGGIVMDRLPLRAAAGDPCALSRRQALTAVSTLTLRRAPRGETSFVLHWRDPAKVNHAGGMYQVMPAGIFQPVAGTPAAERGDLSLWRCMTREFSEELLGTTEDYGTRDGVLDYGGWPFYRRLTSARSAGTLSVWCLGVGVDPLTFATDILTVAVFDSDVFDAVFHGLVELNAEGRVVTMNGSAGIPFTAGTVARFSGGSEPMQPAGAALLQLAWQHRGVLLG